MATKAELRQTIDDFSLQQVPHEHRKSLLELTMVYLGCSLSVTAWLVGPLLSKGLGLTKGILAILIGNALITLYAIAISNIGRHHGTSTADISVKALGVKGQAISTVVTVLVLLGFVGVYTTLFGNFLHKLWGWMSPEVGGLLFIIMLLSSTLFGFKGLAHLTKIMIPLVVILIVWGLFALGDQLTSEKLFATPVGGIGFLAGISAVFSTWATYATMSADTGRYGKSLKDISLAVIFAWAIGTSALEIVGLILAVATGTGNLVILMTNLGLVIPAFILYWGLMWTSGDNLLWSFSLGFSNIEQKVTGKSRVGRAGWVVVAAIIAYIIGVYMINTGIVGAFTGQLRLVGIAVPPLGGVLLAEFYFFKGTGEPQAIKWPGLICWVLGALACIYVPVGIVALEGLVVSLVLYAAYYSIAPALKRSEKFDTAA